VLNWAADVPIFSEMKSFVIFWTVLPKKKRTGSKKCSQRYSRAGFFWREAKNSKYIDIAIYFGEFLKSRGLIPIIIELIPNAGRLWTPAEKIRHFKKECDTTVIIATPDEVQDDRPLPRMDATFEMGYFGDKKSIVLKEHSTTLPKSLDPIYISFDFA